MIKKCKICGKNFEYSRNTKMYCTDCAKKIKNNKTSNIMKIKEQIIRNKNSKRIICPVCGKEFMCYKNNQKFCSNNCYKENSRRLSALRYKKRGHYKKVTYNKKCKICGKNFYTTNNMKIYCSENCSKLARKYKMKERNKKIAELLKI